MSARWSKPQTEAGGLLLNKPQALDIYMVWDRLTDQARHFGAPRTDEALNRADLHWPVMLEFAAGSGQLGLDAWCRLPEVQASGEAAAIQEAFSASIASATTSRIHTAVLPRRLEPLLLAGVEGGALARFQLGAPCTYAGPATRDERAAAVPALRSPLRTLGVIDDGCCFAHEDFRGGAGDGRGCRVHALWDQSPAALAEGRWSGLRSFANGAAYRYGVEMLQADLDAVLADHPVLGEAAERRLYDTIQRPAWGRPSRTHGARVMHLMAGRRTRDDSSLATTLPILFVQLPEQTVGDVTGDSLGMHVVDGARYIVERTQAMAGGSAQWSTTINISLGSIGGPHDGTSMAEIALADLAADSRVTLVMAAGNTAGDRERIHAQQTVRAGSPQRFIVRLPPAHTRDSLVELWFDTRQVALSSFSVRVAAPGTSLDDCEPVRAGRAAVLADAAVEGVPAAPQAAVIFVRRAAQGSNDSLALLCIAPTANRPDTARTLASSGFWTVEVASSSDKPAQVHAWIERDDTIIGARRSQQARFEREGGKADRSVSDDMTLSNLANVGKARVVGGYVVQSAQIASYSANGPLRAGGPLRTELPNAKPDYFAPSDRSQWLPGVAVPGFYSGSHAAISGTSAAAPQVARALADGSPLALLDDPLSTKKPVGGGPAGPPLAVARERKERDPDAKLPLGARWVQVRRQP